MVSSARTRAESCARSGSEAEDPPPPPPSPAASPPFRRLAVGGGGFSLCPATRLAASRRREGRREVWPPPPSASRRSSRLWISSLACDGARASTARHIASSSCGESSSCSTPRRDRTGFELHRLTAWVLKGMDEAARVACSTTPTREVRKSTATSEGWAVPARSSEAMVLATWRASSSAVRHSTSSMLAPGALAVNTAFGARSALWPMSEVHACTMVPEER